MMVAVHLGVRPHILMKPERIVCRRKYHKSGRGETGGGEPMHRRRSKFERPSSPVIVEMNNDKRKRALRGRGDKA
jgi:hypothetical protein